MVNRLYIFLCILLITAPLLAETTPSIQIKNWSTATGFSGNNSVLIHKGDSECFSEINFDDSDWQQTRLPSGWSTLYGDYDGICWYRIHFRIPDTLPEESIGIRLGRIKDIDQTFFNGHLIGETGTFPPDSESAYSIKRLYRIHPHMLKPGEDNVLAIRVKGLFRNGNGPYAGEFKIGPFAELHKDIRRPDILMIIAVTAYILMSIHLMIMHLATRTHKEYIWFALFSFSASIYFLFTTQVIYEYNSYFQLAKRVELVTLALSIILFKEYLRSLFSKERGIVHYAFQLVAVIPLSIFIISDSYILWNTLLRYMLHPLIVLLIFLFPSYIFRNKERWHELRYVAISFILMSIAVINDILWVQNISAPPMFSGYAFILLLASLYHLMYRRIAAVYRKNARASMPAERADSTVATQKITQAKAIIDREYASQLTREEIALRTGLHPDYLSSAFNRTYNIKIGDYIHSRRIEEAVKMLHHSDMPIVMIAHEVGYESISTFYRAFKKLKGISPKKYRSTVSMK